MDLASDPLITRVIAEENQTIDSNDARVTIEMNQYKYTDVPVTTLQMAQLTSRELVEAIRQYHERRKGNHRLEQKEIIDESEDSGVRS